MIAWLFDDTAGDWPREPFQLTPGTEVPDPARWCPTLRAPRASGREANRAWVLAERRRLVRLRCGAVGQQLTVVMPTQTYAVAGSAW